MGSRLREPGNLFELYCEVSPGDHTSEPHILKKYPENYKNEEELKNLPKFTFPCPLDSAYVQQYSFVLTSVDSKYTFCFCRYDPKANKALVILSHLPWHDLFYKLLNCIANLVNGPDRHKLNSFLEVSRCRRPSPGSTFKVACDNDGIIFSAECPDNKLPRIPDNCNLTEYFSALDAHCMAGLWAALLHERRIAIVASKPSRLSACVQAANATLFPMSWQHIFIPILPKHLIDYLLAPMPFLIGVPRSVMSSVRLSEVGEVVIVDVDANELRSPFNDLDTLPPDMVANLQKALSDKNALGDAVSRAFLRALVTLIGGYRDAIKIEKGHMITFSEEAFIKTRKNMQPFLKKILQSQIFQQFIDERLELLNSGRGFNDEFEVECNYFADRVNAAGGQKLKQQYKDWAKNVRKEGGAFFRNVKDKVRQGGKNMKSAVKGFKIKMPKTGSRPSSLNTTDDSRFSCGSATPVSSDSESPPERPSRDPPLPLDLLTEMEFLFGGSRRDSLPPTTTAQLRIEDKSKTLSPRPPPRLPERPPPTLRYPIVSTRKLVDLSDAPVPPPRNTHSNHFISNITKNDTATEFQTTTIRFQDNGKEKLKLSLSNQRRPSKTLRPPEVTNKGRTHEPAEEVDLIKLDDSPPDLADFDPLKRREPDPLKSTDSALLHEYGLDFSQFGMSDFSAGSSTQDSSVPKGWTTFN
ncbi:DENN domain-containing protein 1A-like isoform X2 [Aricia agestis]|uniref:DENN domain-containing protein 1A-like isoform X2 n=1 Tax=Aricia agestis TaxID=91739 RepID=UPI001C203C8A|nr:DENN domain-containing protein 1A-like isoform X2 [Aricia agestis]